MLSIDTDKTNEEDLHRSIAKAKKLLEPHNALLVEYTSYADTSSLPGHYVIFWEIKAAPPFATSTPDTDYATVLQECCVAVEEELDYIYRRFTGVAGPTTSRWGRWRYAWSSRARFMG